MASEPASPGARRADLAVDLPALASGTGATGRPESAPPVSGPCARPVSGETEPIVLSRGNLFCVLSRRGDIFPPGARDLGLFHEDTRHLSRLELQLSGGPPTVLSAEAADSSESQIDLTLSDREFGGLVADPRNFLHIRRRQLLDGEYVERIALTNYLFRPIDVDLALRLEADFADIFEVRGACRERSGTPLPPEVGPGRLVFAYRGVDGATYRTIVTMTPEPAEVTTAGPRWHLTLEPGESLLVELSVEASRGDARSEARPWKPFDVRRATLHRAHREFLDGCTRVHASDSRFEALLGRALGDIDSLRLQVGPHRILGAGIPWFAAPFGRDAIITSLQCLAVAPSLAKETLRSLAAWQGARFDPWTEEEPGKILHELRRGEMTRAGEAPHAPYYGTIDATPLFLHLLAETQRWTGDAALLDELWPAAERALAWIERRLVEGEGLLCYQRTHTRGLENQGWKDSRDGVSFPDGRIARPPIALVEAQGYAVAALDGMGRLRRRRGDVHGGALCHRRANALRRRIEERFWVEESGYYALALDGEGRRVETIASNPGHLGFCRAYGSPSRAARVAEVLLSDAMWSGWGIRTAARGQAVFNPLSYHNGTVWPHDSALCALGMAMNGHSHGALTVLEGLYAASLHFRDLRLPELFCGMARTEGDFLVHYPVSCSPQAWASGACFMLLHAALGLLADAPLHRLVIRNPQLPEFLRRLDLEGMQVGASRVSLHFSRHNGRTHVDLVDVSGDDRLKVNIEIG
jgi:glycogen debranching enzyme